MNTRVLFGTLALGMLLVAGSASALTATNYLGREIGTPGEREGGADVAGLFSADAGAYANADYSGAVKAADDAKYMVAETAKATIDAAMSAQAEAQGRAVRKADVTADASTDAGSGLLAGLQANLEAFGGWISSLWVKPSVDQSHAAQATAVGDIVADVANMDGSVQVDAAQDLESTARVDYNLPPPPAPSTGFLTSIKMAFESFLALE